MFAFLAPLIEGLMAALSRLFATRIGTWIATAAAAIGISFATQHAVIDPILDQVRTSAAGIPADLAQWLGVLNVDRYITIVLSAYTAGALKRVLLAKRGAG